MSARSKSRVDYLRSLYAALDKIKKLQDRSTVNSDDITDPFAKPLVWISRWVDYSTKYGFGYKLCDGTFGILFKDQTQMVLPAMGPNVVLYFKQDGTEKCFLMDQIPACFEKKVKIFTAVKRYMAKTLIDRTMKLKPNSEVQLSRTPRIVWWHVTAKGMIMQLSCGVLQINFKDHTKLILCPLMGTVTYFDHKSNIRTMRLGALREHGCTPDLYDKLKFAWKEIVHVLLSNK